MTDLTHLQRLEAESIHIMREVVAEADNPVMLYSVGKDSAVMLHLAKKAFFPSPPPFPPEPPPTDEGREVRRPPAPRGRSKRTTYSSPARAFLAMFGGTARYSWSSIEKEPRPWVAPRRAEV